MNILLNSEERTFLIHRDGYFQRDYFCNLAHIPEIIKTELEKNDDFTISEYWNYKFKKCSKTHLNKMFAAHKINFKIN